jgi:endonuclease III
MEIEKQISSLVPLLLSAQQKQKITQQTYQSLNGRLSTLVYILGDSPIDSYKDLFSLDALASLKYTAASSKKSSPNLSYS